MYLAALNHSATSAPNVAISAPATAGTTMRLPSIPTALTALALDTRRSPTTSMVSVNRVGISGAIDMPTSQAATSTCQYSARSSVTRSAIAAPAPSASDCAPISSRGRWMRSASSPPSGPSSIGANPAAAAAATASSEPVRSNASHASTTFCAHHALDA